jgi:hypothetical protein
VCGVWDVRRDSISTDGREPERLREWVQKPGNVMEINMEEWILKGIVLNI